MLLITLLPLNNEEHNSTVQNKNCHILKEEINDRNKYIMLKRVKI